MALFCASALPNAQSALPKLCYSFQNGPVINALNAGSLRFVLGAFLRWSFGIGDFAKTFQKAAPKTSTALSSLQPQ